MHAHAKIGKSESNQRASERVRMGRNGRPRHRRGRHCTTCQKRVQHPPVFISSGHRLSSYHYDLIKRSINVEIEGRTGKGMAERSSVLPRLIRRGANSSISPRAFLSCSRMIRGFCPNERKPRVVSRPSRPAVSAYLNVIAPDDIEEGEGRKETTNYRWLEKKLHLHARIRDKPSGGTSAVRDY